MQPNIKGPFNRTFEKSKLFIRIKKQFLYTSIKILKYLVQLKKFYKIFTEVSKSFSSKNKNINPVKRAISKLKYK